MVDMTWVKETLNDNNNFKDPNSVKYKFKLASNVINTLFSDYSFAFQKSTRFPYGLEQDFIKAVAI